MSDKVETTTLSWAALVAAADPENYEPFNDYVFPIGPTEKVYKHGYNRQIPVISVSLPSGTYVEEQTVSITTDIPATIYYTTNGQTPTRNSARYSSALPLLDDTTLKVFAVADSGGVSDVATYTYVINYLWLFSEESPLYWARYRLEFSPVAIRHDIMYNDTLLVEDGTPLTDSLGRTYVILGDRRYTFGALPESE